jgi:hypothetical protein
MMAIGQLPQHPLALDGHNLAFRVEPPRPGFHDRQPMPSKAEVDAEAAAFWAENEQRAARAGKSGGQKKGKAK